MALKVIGAGGPRTGTASLKVALETLGFGKCYHMEWVFNNTHQVKNWMELYETGKTNFDELFDGFQSTVDFPGHLNYKVLLKQYPDAKVILTERDPELWYESSLKTVYSVTPKTFMEKLAILGKFIRSKRFRELSGAFRLVEKYLWKGFYGNQFGNKEKALELFHKHNEEVKAHVPAEQLLIFRPEHGWEPLCEFLGVPVPEVPYPKKNQRKEFHEQISRMVNTGEKLELK